MRNDSKGQEEEDGGSSLFSLVTTLNGAQEEFLAFPLLPTGKGRLLEMRLLFLDVSFFVACIALFNFSRP